MAVVIGKARLTGKRKLINTFPTDRAAERFCDMWGWFYDDGRRTYSLEVVSHS